PPVRARPSWRSRSRPTCSARRTGSPPRPIAGDKTPARAHARPRRHTPADAPGPLTGAAAPGGGDSMPAAIRRQPFSVVLLDEFEKAHPRAWDLFLQVFDDGRLTDAYGNLADFRYAIIVLTSNLGATQHRSASLGFNPAGGEFSEQQILRVIGDTFRPEFINRLDRVVVFRPLSRVVMREILKKELRSVLQRRGFRNREWAVEWEESALEFLLDKGFTPDMGARPLR